MITALNDTLFFGLVFSTEKPKGIGDCNSTLGNRLPLALLWREGMHGIPSD